MKVLVATKETQGRRRNDFSHANEIELVGFPVSECDSEPVDGRCGCRRSFCGFISKKATTTAKVAELEISREAFIECHTRSLAEGGWLRYLKPEDVRSDAEEILRIAAVYEVGDILERRGKKIYARGPQ